MPFTATTLKVYSTSLVSDPMVQVLAGHSFETPLVPVTL